MTPQQSHDDPISITAYDWVPMIAQGYVRDLRLRWALEEAGLPYEVTLLPHAERASAENLRRQPFAQVPAMTVGGRTMFESGACVWRIAEGSPALLPRDPAERDACFSWFFGALDSLEQPIDLIAFLRLFAEKREAAEELLPQAAEALRQRLQRFADALGERSFLVADRFTVADLMATFVLRNVAGTGDLDPFPTLQAYVDRHTVRPAFVRALEAQMRPFRENATRYESAA